MSTTETKVKEMPIPFKGPMVRAILEGRKTQTRRIIKHQDLIEFDESNGEFIFAHARNCPNYCDYACGGLACPYGGVGERLWVKETSRVCSETKGLDPWHSIEYAAGGSKVERGTLPGEWFPKQSHNKDGSSRWHPGMFMPRWASRITLEIKGVRVERLNDISEADATAEGIHNFGGGLGLFGYDPKGTPGPMVGGSATEAFALLWESINGPGSWALNPWVWVIEFKRINNL